MRNQIYLEEVVILKEALYNQVKKLFVSREFLNCTFLVFCLSLYITQNLLTVIVAIGGIAQSDSPLIE